ncbi:MAG: carbamoyl-phosphate synthase large subunit, partial [Bacteroidales bacterium]|nr:carbamoyl-phosphate synthase large subunit [Bacteroidales bacterium]
RWDLRKFQGVSRKIGSSMKSVGEVMAIGRNFEEALQKGLRMIGQGAHGFVMNRTAVPDDLDAALSDPDDTRIFAIAHALSSGYTIERIHELTRIDNWFLHKLRNIVNTCNELLGYSDVSELPDGLLRRAKCQGFSDHQIARALCRGVFDADRMQDRVREWRKNRGIVPCVKQIDTLAAEFPAMTNYLYLTYNGSFDDIEYERDGRSVVVLGSGAYRIGSSVEFDWCSVTALQTIRKAGWRGVMINYNPETVSTDYDICDRLYFEELTLERVLDICELEQPHGTVVSVGGQIPNNLAVRLDEFKVPILGTRACDIDRAEDRHKFSSIVDSLGIDQPEWMELTSRADLDDFIARVGYPVLIRPSYVLSGAAMHVCYDATELDRYLSMAVEVSQQHPVVVSEFMQRCKEIEFDAVADSGKILAYAISEHVEFAGVHSGDATIVFPAQKIYLATMKRLKSIAGKIAEALNITGPFNIQFLAKENFVKVIECNLRASRSFPFVSKVSKVNMIELATQAMLGEHPKPVHKDDFDFDYVGVKASQFSFARLLRADPVLGVDMASTGESGCMGEDFNDALLKSVESVGYTVPDGPVLISSGDALQKADLLDACRQLAAHGYTIYATGGTLRHLEDNGVPARRALWPGEESESPDFVYETALDLIRSRKVRMVINIPKNYTATELENGYKIRRAAVDFNVPLFTNARLATAFVKAFCSMTAEDISIKASDEFKLNT